MKNCIICRKPINRGAAHSKLKERRAPHALTCSRPCAKIYRRIYTYIYALAERRLKKRYSIGN